MKPQGFLVQVCLVPRQRKIFVNQLLASYLLLSFIPARHLYYFLEVKKLKRLSSQVQDLKSPQNPDPPQGGFLGPLIIYIYMYIHINVYIIIIMMMLIILIINIILIKTIISGQAHTHAHAHAHAHTHA